ncbi:hypothetical protein CY34DRAFT_630136 [Suillus luteus UH-Slu-Lm8-n1]|uniref:Uncharacterized protein n=1 Tax=Suillus luteus UH-Slu-Lm8-n1 TaxID=930992 RepID=A0A0D0AEB2_9AGAM|nr:hypothetical protein CY34DRAFT_630136 [Suillus luteus UH-Slu-Lm8-n1]
MSQVSGFMIPQLLPGRTPVQFPRLSRRNEGGCGPMARSNNAALSESSPSFGSESTYSVSSPYQRDVNSLRVLSLQDSNCAHPLDVSTLPRMRCQG